MEWLAGWVSDLLRIGRDRNAHYLNNPDLRAELAVLSGRLRPAAVHRLLQQIFKAKALATSTINKQLLFESLLVRWASLTTRTH